MAQGRAVPLLLLLLVAARSVTGSVTIGGAAAAAKAEGVRLVSAPPHFTEGDHFGLEGLEAGQVVRLMCPAGTVQSCMFYVLHHHCPPCSARANGGLPELLAAKGFKMQSQRCAPLLQLERTGATLHRTVVHQKELLPGEAVAVKLTQPLAAGAVVRAVLPQRSCAAQEHPVLCARVSGCKWNANEQTCGETWCERWQRPKLPSCRESCHALNAMTEALGE